MRDNAALNETIRAISDKEGRLDGLLAAAGIQQETTALEYTPKDANMMFEVNITGTFMAAQAAAKEMIRWGNGGSMAFIASMSGSVANRVRNFAYTLLSFYLILSLLQTYQHRTDHNRYYRASSVPPTTLPKQA